MGSNPISNQQSEIPQTRDEPHQMSSDIVYPMKLISLLRRESRWGWMNLGNDASLSECVKMGSVKCESAQVIHCTCHDGLAGLKHEPHEVSLQLTSVLDSPHRDAALPFPMLV
jgi:hypothetical protein